LITFHDTPQGSELWHLAHKDKWSGSTAIKLLQGKPLPEWGTFAGNKYTQRGKFLEPVAIREFEVAMEAPEGVLTGGYVTNSKYPNAMFSHDGIFGDIILEVKCLNGIRHESLIKGDIPLEYLAQIYFGMVICELKKAKLLAFNPEYEQQLTILDIPYDTAIIENIQRKLEYDKMKQNSHHN